MRIAYLTTDEVNTDFARRWAEDICGCELVPLSPRDPLPNGDYDAAIYDLDHLLPQLRQQVLTNLLKGPSLGPTAVHSYNLRERQTNALRARGVFVRRKLEREILLRLRRAVRRVAVQEQEGRLSTS